MCRLTDLNKKSYMQGLVPFELKGRNRVNLLALGDVGGMLLTGLKLMGGDVIEHIGICDISENMTIRYEMEMNQIGFPLDLVRLPEIEIVTEENLFDCDVFVFCASKSVPQVGAEVQDVRMAQFEGNKSIVQKYARLAVEQGFKGLFSVVSDPVDPLCKAAYLAGAGELSAEQIQGFGLGVMNSRAMYYAKKYDQYRSYLQEGRAFGPHGQDLVIANSVEDYNPELSKELTQLTVNANLETRALGFKPYMAPALSSGAISLLLTLRGEWHYSSNYIGYEQEGAYMGALNRMTVQGTEFEDIELPEELFVRIKKAYDNLKKII